MVKLFSDRRAVRKTPYHLNISRIGRVALMYLGSQSVETLLCIRGQSLSRGTSQTAVRGRWLSLRIVWLSQSQWLSEQIASSRQCVCPFYSSRADIFGKASYHPYLLAFLEPRFGSLLLLAIPKAKIAFERKEICKYDGHTVHKLTQRRLTAHWHAVREYDCSRMHSKFSPHWVPSYIKATWLVLQIFKTVGYSPDSPRTS
jgi:hypothetical protein